jgi:hypothetical protein
MVWKFSIHFWWTRWSRVNQILEKNCLLQEQRLRSEVLCNKCYDVYLVSDVHVKIVWDTGKLILWHQWRRFNTCLLNVYCISIACVLFRSITVTYSPFFVIDAGSRVSCASPIMYSCICCLSCRMGTIIFYNNLFAILTIICGYLENKYCGIKFQ